MLKHYHVMHGMHGYLPDSNMYCENMAMAKMCLQENIKNMREYGDLRFNGSLKNKYFDCTHTDYYAEISDPCYEKECIEYRDMC